MLSLQSETFFVLYVVLYITQNVITYAGKCGREFYSMTRSLLLAGLLVLVRI